MNKSLSVFLSVLLCVVLYVGVLLLRYTTDESDYWQSSQVYTSSAPAGAPAVSFGVGANGDVLAVPMSSRYSSRERYLQPSRRSTGVANLQGFSRSANSTGMLSHPSLQGGDGGRLFTHMSSSHTMKSFGGGSNTGVSMSGGVVSNSASSLGSGVSVGIQSPIAYTQLPTINTQSPIVSNYQGVGNTTTTAPRGMRGRQNAAPGFGDPWWGWWDDWVQRGAVDSCRVDDGNGGWDYSFDRYQLENAYEAFLADYWNKGMGVPPSFDEWLDWYITDADKEGGMTVGNNTYHWVPVGDVLPLLLLAFLYIAAIYIRFRFRTQSNG